MAADTQINEPVEQIRIQLLTKDPSLQLPQKTGPILVSTNLTRYPLSKLVNTLLSSSSPVPLDFLVNSRHLLTSTLSTYLSSHGLSTENVLNLEYTPALLPPKPSSSFQHDSWVGAVDVLSSTCPAAASRRNQATIQSGQEVIASGAFDGCVRIWSSSGSVIAQSEGAQPPDQFGNARLSDGRHPAIHGLKWISPTHLVAGGDYAYLRVFEYTAPDTIAGKGHLKEMAHLHGHLGFVSMLSIDATSQTVLSASPTDHTARLFSANISDPSALKPDPDILPKPSSLSSSKRRKTATDSLSIPGAGPILTLQHSNPVNAALLHPSQPTIAAYTASRHGALQLWDLSQQTSIAQRALGADRDLRGLASLPTLQLAVTGSNREAVCVDMREGAQKAVSLRLQGHRGIVGSVTTASEGTQGAEYVACTSSFDGTVRIWDVRNVRAPLATDAGGAEGATSTAEGGAANTVSARFVVSRRDQNGKEVKVKGEGRDMKVFDVCWDKSVGIVSAGQDGMVQIDSY